MATTERYFYGTGRRKTSVARVRLYPGSGEILINGKGYLEVFTRGGHFAGLEAPDLLISDLRDFFRPLR